MKRNTINGVQYYTFGCFEETGLVRHCFTTRLGGVSEDCHESLNLGYSRGDNPDHVDENYRRLSEAVGFDRSNMVLSDQCHGTNIYAADETDRGKGLTRESDIKQVDGLVTQSKNVVLTTFFADCVPLFFLDPYKKVIALTHAGWRGSLAAIAQLTLEKMYHFGCRGEDILVGIGPSIGGCCFEVDFPVAEEFLATYPFSKEFIAQWEDKPDKYFIDLWSINAEILIRSGVSDKNIELSGLCTMCNPDIFYSHRIMGNERGTMAAMLELI